jgi:thiol-disulfide isomerase/thioredoxin
MMVGVTNPAPEPPRAPLLSRRGLLGATVLGLGVLVACDDEEPDTAQSGPTKRIPQDKRTIAPTIKGTLLDGGSYDLASSTAGDVVVLNFWGSWCGPCRTEAPDLQAVYERFRSQGVEFVGVNVRDDLDKAKAFVARYRLGYPSIQDPGSKLASTFADLPALSTPATLVIDRQGRVASVSPGAISKAQLETLIGETLAESPAEPSPPATPSTSGPVG